MDRKSFFFLMLVILFFVLVSPTFLPILPMFGREQASALEKVKLGGSVKMAPEYYLPALTAEERGFWKENGLEVEWVPFAGGAPQMRAVAAGALKLGMATSAATMTAAGGGLPVLMASELISSQAFNIWVRADSPYQHPRDLKGARVGVTALGAITHAFGRIILAAHGIEKDVRFVGAGGVRENVAGIRAGAFEAMITSFGTVVDLKIGGILREIATAGDYLPKPWFEQVVFAQKEFAQGKPDVVKKMLKATLQSLDFLRKNPRWAMDKIKSFQGLSEEAAKLVFDDTKFTITGKLDRKAVENMRRLFIEYGIITEKAPAVDELFTNEYLPG